jgi:hypothetical protein
MEFEDSGVVSWQSKARRGCGRRGIASCNRLNYIRKLGGNILFLQKSLQSVPIIFHAKWFARPFRVLHEAYRAMVEKKASFQSSVKSTTSISFLMITFRVLILGEGCVGSNGAVCSRRSWDN